MTAHTCPGCSTKQDVLWRSLPMHRRDGAPWPERGPFPAIAEMCPWSMGDVRAGQQHAEIARRTAASQAPALEVEESDDGEEYADIDDEVSPVIVFTPAPEFARSLGTCGSCGSPVQAADFAVRDQVSGAVWHADCWSAHEAPGQGDLLDILAVGAAS